MAPQDFGLPEKKPRNVRKAMIFFTALRKVFRILSPRGRVKLCWLVILTLLSAMMETIGIAAWIPFVSFGTNPEVVRQNPLMQRLYTLAGFTDYTSFLVFLGGGLLFLFLTGNVCRAATVWLCYRFSWGENHRMSQLLLDRYLRHPYVWFLRRNSADLAKNVIEEVGNTVEYVFQKLCMCMVRGFLAVLICIGLLLMDPLIAFTTAAFLTLIYSMFYRYFRGNLTRLGQVRLDSNRLRYKAVMEALSAVKEAKAPSSLPYFLETYRRHSLRTNELRISSELIGDLPGYLTEALAVGGMLAVMIYFLATQGGSSSALTLIALYIVAAIRLTPALQNIYQDIVKIRFFLPSLDKIHEELGGGGQTVLTAAVEERLEFKQSLRLEGLCYSYPGSGVRAISDVTLEILRSTSTALVGKTGAGKTTVADIVAGLLEPQEGVLRVDGTPLCRDRISQWQLDVGYVPQEIYLLDDTVQHNIAFGVPEDDIDHMAVVRAAKAANIHDFITGHLDKGYDAVLGERGISLSGGQRQRIGIARALYPDPEVLIFDEATSALDSLTERAVMDAIRQLSRRKTLIVIAHRLTTVKVCDSICFLEDGRVAAQGDFDELMKSCPAFRELARGELSRTSVYAFQGGRLET